MNEIEKVEDNKEVSIFDLPELPYTTRKFKLPPNQIKNILDEYANTNKSLTSLTKENGIDLNHFLEICEKFAEIGGYYERAQKVKADLYREEIAEIADDPTADYVERTTKNGSTYLQMDHENVKRSELRVKTRQWLMERINPDKYGSKEKIDITSKNLSLNINVDPSQVNLDSLSSMFK